MGPSAVPGADLLSVLEAEIEPDSEKLLLPGSGSTL